MKLNKLLFPVLASGMLLTVSCEKDNFSAEQEEAVVAKEQLSFVPNEVLVKFKDGKASTKARSNALSLIQGVVVETIQTSAMKSANRDEVLLVSSKLSTLNAIAQLKGVAEVEYAEPNFIYHHNATSNDPAYTNGTLWGMYGDATTPSNQYGSQAGEAWAAGNTGSNTVYIGIIDEGYMYMHEDLAANAGTNPGEIAGNGVDDDNNGYIDDVYGWDFDGNDNSVFDGIDDDHGTHVAGTIGGVGNNGTGIAGVAWNVKLMSGKFLGRRGGTTANAIKAVDYFTGLKQNGVNIVATNNSWGGGGFSQGLYDAIDRANQAGILFIAAAGNETNNNDSNLSYPGSYTNSNIIAVASITNSGGLSSFSNYGATTVDLGAPGSGIYSSVPTRSKGQILSGYATYSGTSMATPHVSGGAALYASSYPGATAAEIKNAIMSSAVPTSSLTGKCVTGGRLNVSGF
ncbi:subtilase family protein [Gillisia sp. Hel_I_86]|uniref:S8 family peptidase n=1 Tax=Gillisia sp. Hel_I_86 TaxID=1249981 RepID=UPI00119C21FD|nr:S8 family peptidase [Gillisia sp. Hel_I_86]TVZ25799.1 subtilase family protein [Gillisia sp. Hel_I_86]